MSADSNVHQPEVGPHAKSPLIEGAVRLGLLLILVFWCFQIVSPFILPVIWGAIIAVAIYPLFAKLKAALGGRNKAAATVYAVVALACLLTPMIMVVDSIAETIQSFVTQYDQGELVISPPNASVQDWPIVGEKVYTVWTQASESLSATVNTYRDELKDFGKTIIESAGSASGNVMVFLISILVSAVFMANAAAANDFGVRLFSRITSDEQGAHYASLTRDTVRSIAQGVLGIAVIQSVLSGFGMWVMDVPAWGLWTVLVLVLAIVQLPPLLVLGFAAAYVFSEAAAMPATLFAIYAVFVSTSDAWLKPMLLGRGLEIPMLVILIGAIGGMLFSGVIGLFVGAVVLAIGYELFMAWLKQGEVPQHTD